MYFKGTYSYYIFSFHDTLCRPNFSEIEHILKKSFAIRSSKDIELIHNAVDSHLTLDLLYNALSHRQRLVMIKYIELVNEFDADNSYTDGLLVLLRGRATATCRGQSLIINAKPGCDIEAQHVLGQLSIPNSSTELFFNHKEVTSRETSLYNQFVSENI